MAVNKIPDDLSSPKQVAEVIHVAERTVRLWGDQGLITSYRLPGKLVKFSMAEVLSKIEIVPARTVARPAPVTQVRR